MFPFQNFNFPVSMWENNTRQCPRWKNKLHGLQAPLLMSPDQGEDSRNLELSPLVILTVGFLPFQLLIFQLLRGLWLSITLPAPWAHQWLQQQGCWRVCT